jgi:hypothetical protein
MGKELNASKKSLRDLTGAFVCVFVYVCVSYSVFACARACAWACGLKIAFSK